MSNASPSMVAYILSSVLTSLLMLGCSLPDKPQRIGPPFGGAFTPLPDPRKQATSLLGGVEGGGAYTCAFWDPSGGVYCWGDNDEGQWGTGNVGPTIGPDGAVSLATNVVQISAGSHTTCARKRDGAVDCWGDDLIGDNSIDRSVKPANIHSASEPAIDVSKGYNHGCLVLQNGIVRCWGSNTNGQLGTGTFSTALGPVNVTSITDGVAVAAGVDHTCAVRTGGKVSCWGSNSYGQIGSTTPQFSQTTPADVVGIKAIDVTAGSWHTCALLQDRRVACWGWNRYGQLGTGPYDDKPHPTPQFVPGVDSVVELSTSAMHTCALLADGRVKCWGANQVGQCGIAPTNDPVPPTVVSNLPAIDHVSAGSSHTCAIDNLSSLHCWGSNHYGQLADGTTTNSHVPVP